MIISDADAIAEIIYNKVRMDYDRGNIITPPNVGLEMYDTIEVDDVTCSQTDAGYRVQGWTLEYDSGLQKGHIQKYEQNVRIGTV
jgi:hypothetical protein